MLLSTRETIHDLTALLSCIGRLVIFYTYIFDTHMTYVYTVSAEDHQGAFRDVKNEREWSSSITISVVTM